MCENNDRDAPDVDVSGQEWGSDFIADFLAGYGFEFISFTPGSSFRGLEESIVNYRDDDPRVIETPHEGLSVSIAHGYGKATGEPAVCVLHDVVGTLHGAMGLFNAYCDRVPLLALAGAGPIRKGMRRPYFDWIHTTSNQGTLVDGYTKYSSQPAVTEDVSDALLRALRLAQTPPKGPTYVALDRAVQENALSEPIDLPDFGAFAPATPPGPDRAAIQRAATLLADAELPVLLVDAVGDSRAAAEELIELAEALGAAVVPSHRVGTPHRFNFPNTHPLDLSGTDVVGDADVILALDVFSPDFTLTETESTTRESVDLVDEKCAIIDIGLRDARTGAVAGDQFGLRETDLSIAADTAAAIPELVTAVRDVISGDDVLARRVEERRAMLSERHDAQRAAWEREADEAWDDVPISLPRLAGTLWEVVRDEDWTLVNGTLRGWAYRLWEIDAFDEYVGGYSGGGGIGYGIGAAIGGALAYEGDRIPINLQPDGDLMFYPGGLWTISHYDLPILTVMHNNRSLYNSTRHRMDLASHRGRDTSLDRALIGTGLDEPVPDYATMAESMGMDGYGPIEEPDDLEAELRSAWETVRAGEPALVDVVCQPR